MKTVDMRKSKQLTVQYKSRQRGASLLEGVAYLGIAALVLIGAVSLLGSAISSAQSNRTLEELIALRTAAKKLYSGQRYPKDGMVDTLVTANAIPGTMVVTRAVAGSNGNTGTSASIQNGFGGTVTIVGNDSGANEFKITYPNVPPASCVAILSGANGWREVKVKNGTALTKFPISAKDAASECGNEDKEIEFTAT